MAATRSYVRGSNGRFAGAGAGTKVTQGRSGGFANATFRARVSSNRSSAALAKGGAVKRSGPRTRPKSAFLDAQQKQALKRTAGKAAVAAAVIGASRVASGRRQAKRNARRDALTAAVNKRSLNVLDKVLKGIN